MARSASRQPGSQQAIRPGGELDDGRQRHQPFGTFRGRSAKRRRMHGIQAWVALPETLEEAEPSFVHHAAEELPVFGESGPARLIAGRPLG